MLNLSVFYFVCVFLILPFNFKLGGAYASAWVNLAFLFVSYLVFSYKANSIRYSQSFIWFLIFYIFYSVLLSLFTAYDAVSFLKIFSIILFAFVTYHYLSNGMIDLNNFIKMLFWLFLILSVRYVIEFYDYFGRLDWNENRPYPDFAGGYNQFASLVSLSIIWGLMFLTGWKKNVFLIFQFLILLTTFSRGGMLSLFLPLFFYYVYSLRRLSTIKLAFLFILILLPLVFLLSDYSNVFADRFIFSMFSDNPVEVTSGRNFQWAYVYHSFVNAPLWNLIFGFGMGTYHYLTEDDPHNVFLQMYWEFGFIAPLIVMLIFGHVFYGLRNWAGNRMSTFFFLSFMSFLINFMVEGYLYSIQTGYIFGIYVGLVLYYISSSTKKLSIGNAN